MEHYDCIGMFGFWENDMRHRKCRGLAHPCSKLSTKSGEKNVSINLDSLSAINDAGVVLSDLGVQNAHFPRENHLLSSALRL